MQYTFPIPSQMYPIRRSRIGREMSSSTKALQPSVKPGLAIRDKLYGLFVSLIATATILIPLCLIRIALAIAAGVGLRKRVKVDVSH